MFEILARMALALALTLAVETGLAFLLKVRDGSDILCVVEINCITNPALNYLLTAIGHFSHHQRTITVVSVIVLEVLAVLAEALFYRKNLTYAGLRAIPLSLILNLASFSVGLLLTGLLTRSGYLFL